MLTLITAMHLNRGGNPLGPAGNSKTENVKDLSRHLSKYVVVINCSDGMDYKVFLVLIILPFILLTPLLMSNSL